MATFGLVATGRSDLQRVGERISRPLGPEISRIEMPSPSDIGGHQTGQPFLMPGSHRLSESSRATAVSNRGTQSTIPAFDRADLSMRGHDTGPVRLTAKAEPFPTSGSRVRIPSPAPVRAGPNSLRHFRNRQEAELPQAIAGEAWGFDIGTIRQISLRMPICLRGLGLGFFADHSAR
jgi:hypothetical protein